MKASKAENKLVELRTKIREMIERKETAKKKLTDSKAELKTEQMQQEKNKILVSKL